MQSHLILINENSKCECKLQSGKKYLHRYFETQVKFGCQTQTYYHQPFKTREVWIVYSGQISMGILPEATCSLSIPQSIEQSMISSLYFAVVRSVLIQFCSSRTWVCFAHSGVSVPHGYHLLSHSCSTLPYKYVCRKVLSDDSIVVCNHHRVQ